VCTGQCLVPRLANTVNRPLSGVGRTGYNSPDCPVSQAANDTRPRQRSAHNLRLPRVPIQMSLGHIGLSDAPSNCLVCHGASSWQLFTVRVEPDSPVHPRTEGNQCFPIEEQMAPLALGAIKGPLGVWSITPSIL
jgi:hypothetical protein